MKRYNDNILQHLKWMQNKAPNITALMEKKARWREVYNDEFWASWEADVFNIKTAKQFGLALWGIILGVSFDLFNFNPATQHWAFGKNRQNFVYDGQYHNPALPANKQSKGGNFGNADISLTNLDDIRTLLRFRYATLVSNGRIQYMNYMMNMILNDGKPWDIANKKYAYAIDNTSVPVPLAADVWIHNWQGLRKIPTGSSSGRHSYILQSEDLSLSSLVKVGTTVKADEITAPDGKKTADFLVSDTTTGHHDITLVTSGTYPTDQKYVTFSVFLKADGYRNIGITISHTQSGQPDELMSFNTYDAASRTIGGGGQVSSDVYPNAWSRVVITVPLLAGKTGSKIKISLIDDDANISFKGDGKSGAYIWGYMMEATSDQTLDYVPITDAASADIGPNNVTSAGVISFGRVPTADMKIYWSGAWGIGSYAAPVFVDNGDGTKNAFQITRPLNDGAAVTKVNYIEFRIGKNVNLSDALILLMNERENGLIFQNACVEYKVVKES